jgi:hypothetical protein
MMTRLCILAIYSLLIASGVGQDSAGIIRIEAESFQSQSKDDKRQWKILEQSDASGGRHIQALPDTRRSHADKLVKGENFTDKAGEMAILEYKIEVGSPGRYFVWARVFSKNSEDNGLHVGLDGQWPESGRRWQTVKKGGWQWDCKQRTEAVHTGVPMQLWLDIPTAGEHTLALSMREDGCSVDEILLAKSPDFRPPGVESAEEKPKPKLVARQADGGGAMALEGELKQWHKITLTMDGPFAAEADTEPNPFTDLAFRVVFEHESGVPRVEVPGYFAADGAAGESGATAGVKWRAHLAPEKAGAWKWRASFHRGPLVALEGGGEPVAPFHGPSGTFTVVPSDKTGRDFRARGRLQYVGERHLRFAGSGEYFLKAGPDSPESLLACADIDGTEAGRSGNQRSGEAQPMKRLKTWAPHQRDWREGDPQWRGGKGRGMVGALNYLAGQGLNAFSFLTYNVSGDGDNVWPFSEREAKLSYDCSKLDQWGVLFDHATAQGLYLHFKLQENELDDERMGHKRQPGSVPAALDGGRLGPERKLYCREMVARFGHALALNWNIGEENTQSAEEVRAMASYLRKVDPYDHLIVLHTFPDQQDDVYKDHLGDKASITGVSLQNSWNHVHQRTLQWIKVSKAAGHPWVVANDEQGPAGLGVPPDAGYKGHDGIALERDKKKEDPGSGDVKAKAYTLHDVRKGTLWGNLMAGGAGVEYYFGYTLPENDLACEDWRSREQSWQGCRVALEFFTREKLPFWQMESADALVDNPQENNSRYCLALPGEIYLVYLPNGGETSLDLSAAKGSFRVQWLNPRAGGPLVRGKPETVSGGGKVQLGPPPADVDEDWAALLRKD